MKLHDLTVQYSTVPTATKLFIFTIVVDRHRFHAGADSDSYATSILRCRSNYRVLSITREPQIIFVLLLGTSLHCFISLAASYMCKVQLYFWLKWIRFRIRLWIRQNDADPTGSVSTTLMFPIVLL